MMTEVFCLRDVNGQPYWMVIVDDVLIKAEWRSKGAAEAAIEVERARRARRNSR